MIRLPSNIGCRLPWVAIALLIFLVPIIAPTPAGSQETPDPRPETLPFFHDADGVFAEDQVAALKRDAQLLQSTGIPTLVYVRAVPASDAARANSQEFAAGVRRAWRVESAAGANDGLVLLFSWVPQDPLASSTVLSYGAHTFDGSGLSPEAIQESIDTSVRSLVEQERPFEAVLYLMRETRYAGIYTPPPPAPVEGVAGSVNGALRWAGPLVATGTIGALALLTRTFWRVKPTHTRIWATVVLVLMISAALWSVAVYVRSEAGVASALLIVAALALAAWIWSRLGFERHGSRPVRRRAVPSTLTLMRRRHQARALLARESGSQR